jgi:hypothetical protein
VSDETGKHGEAVSSVSTVVGKNGALIQRNVVGDRIEKVVVLLLVARGECCPGVNGGEESIILHGIDAEDRGCRGNGQKNRNPPISSTKFGASVGFAFIKM